MAKVGGLAERGSRAQRRRRKLFRGHGGGAVDAGVGLGRRCAAQGLAGVQEFDVVSKGLFKVFFLDRAVVAAVGVC